MNAPDYCRLIGEPLYSELIDMMRNGEHIALLGPPQGGKLLVLQELQKLINNLAESDRPKTIFLRGTDRTSAADLVQQLAAQLPIISSNSSRGHIRPATVFKNLICDALENPTALPVWIFVRDILRYPAPLCRELLTAFRWCHAELSPSSRLAVIVTGSADLIHLVQGQSSPFCHSKSLLIAGMDKATARNFFCHRRERQTCNEIMDEGAGLYTGNVAKWITAPAFNILYKLTNGNPHLIQEIVTTASRHSTDVNPADLTLQWTERQTRQCIDSFIRTGMRNDHFCRMSIREAERFADTFDVLLNIYRDGDQKIDIPGQGPHPLEAHGLIRRTKKGKGIIASPLWRAYLDTVFTNAYIGDIYASQHRWEEAWQQYQQIDVQMRDRPVASATTFRLRSTLSHWEESLADKASHGSESVWIQFTQGARYLLGFDGIGLYDVNSNLSSKSLIQIEPNENVPSYASLDTLRSNNKPIHEDANGQQFWIDENFRVLVCDPNLSLPGRLLDRGVQPILCMVRKGFGREINPTEHQYLWRALNRFWQAYSTAVQIENEKIFGELRRRHLNVIDGVTNLLVRENFDIGKVVQGTADLLISRGNYSRVLICLVDAKRERIQAVAHQNDGETLPFRQRTDFPLFSKNDIAEWDIQPWVVRQGAPCVVTDSTLDTNRNPRTHVEQARLIGMKAIIVVPMAVGDEIIGTIHFELKHKQVPSQQEALVCFDLAEQIAVLFYQAQRQTLLNGALSQLSDEIQIISPNERILFLNKSAAQTKSVPPGWQKNSLVFEDQDNLFYRVEKTGESEHAYAFTDSKGRQGDRLLAPIDDFRKHLKPPFKGAISRIGYVDRFHDLGDTFDLISALQNWLAIVDTRERGQKILEYLKGQGFNWARLYLLEPRSEPKRDGDMILASFESVGYEDDKEGRLGWFKGGGQVYTRHSDPQAFHVIDKTGKLTIYEVNPNLKKRSIIKAPPHRGILRYWVKEVEHSKALGKSDKIWVDVPLLVKGRVIGKISMALPNNENSERWEMLDIISVGAAIALDTAKQAELQTVEKAHLAAQVAEQKASKSAAAAFFHKSANKFGPIPSLLKAAIDQLSNEQEKTRATLELANKSLMSGIFALRDMARYAYIGDMELVDLQSMEVETLLRHLQVKIEADYPEIGNIEISSQIMNVEIKCSPSAMAEVFDLLISNSIRHSGLTPAALNLRIKAVAVDRKTSRKLGISKCVALIYDDNGNGISATDRQKIFQPFFTSHLQGTGLGLAIAKEYCHRQEAEIQCDDSHGKGATFVIYLTIINPREGIL